MEKFYNLNEVAELLGVHSSTIARKCKDGTLKCINLGTEKRAIYRIPASSISND